VRDSAPRIHAAPPQAPRQVERPREQRRTIERPASPSVREAVRPPLREQQARPSGQENRQAVQPANRDNLATRQRPVVREAPSVVVRSNRAGQDANAALTSRALRSQAFASQQPRNATERALARSTFLGRFAARDAQWRGQHAHRPHHRGFVIGWVGPLFWPYASYDFVDYTFFPYAYDSFWPVAYDDVYQGIFGRYAYAAAYASVRQPGSQASGTPTAIADLCNSQTASLASWPIAQMAETLALDDAQRAALDGLKDATAQALDVLKSACPTELPNTPTGRLAAMRTRLDAMLGAVRTVRPTLERFYQSLSDEQKARFNALEPEDAPEQARSDLTQVCGENAAGIGALPIERIAQGVRPDAAQRGALNGLQDAVSEAVNLLKSECPTAQPLTAVGRMEAMEQRLQTMLQAVQTVQPALENFYAALSDEQKERFNRLRPNQG